MNQPTSLSERINLIDIIRGFALFGVLAINMQFFNAPPFASYTLYEPMTSVNRIFELFIRVFIEGKFYTIFSILFGLGFSIQIARLKERGDSFKAIYLRRLIVLFVIGMVHSIVIWDGDILRIYALMGFILFLFHASEERILKRWIKILLPLLYVIAIIGFAVMIIGDMGKTPEELAEIREEHIAEIYEENEPYTSDSYLDVTVARVNLVFSDTGAGSVLAGLINILPLFLVGAMIGRRRILEDVETNKPLIKKVFKYCLIISMVLIAVFVYGFIYSERGERSIPRLLMMSSEILTHLVMAILYFSGIILIFSHKRYQKILMPLSYVGRMALTNYLTQSIVLTLVFYNYGLGFMGQKDLWLLLSFSIGLYTVQVVFSWLWLRIFRFGLFEWLWRSLTYGKIQPLLKEKLST